VSSWSTPSEQECTRGLYEETGLVSSWSLPPGVKALVMPASCSVLAFLDDLTEPVGLTGMVPGAGSGTVLPLAEDHPPGS